MFKGRLRFSAVVIRMYYLVLRCFICKDILTSIKSTKSDRVKPVFPLLPLWKEFLQFFSLLFCSQRLPEDPTTSAHVWTASTLTPTLAPATSSTPASTARLRSTSAPPVSGSTSTRVFATGPPRPIGRTATPVGCQVILPRPNFSISK